MLHLFRCTLLFLLIAAVKVGAYETSQVTVGGNPNVIVRFTDIGSENWIAPTGVSSVSVLIVGGGGGGGHGGGGGGFVQEQNVAVIPGQAYQITVGQGGFPGARGSRAGGVGGASSAFGYISEGGGGGAEGWSNKCAINSIGPAGGASFDALNCPRALATQGGNGGGSDGLGYAAAGGGGGAGGNGSDATKAGNGVNGSGTLGGNGGDGILSSITGLSICYGGGGGGSANTNGAPATGGTGTCGGGNGASAHQSTGTSGINGLGGGAGGSEPETDSFATGGSGIVIIRYGVDVDAPALISSTPSDNSSGVNLDQNILLTFSEDVVAGSGDIKLFEGNGNLVETFVVSSAIIAGSRVTVNPTQNFKSDTGYYVQISASAFVDTASNNYPGITDQTALNFTTRKANASEAFNAVKDTIGNKIQSNTIKRISSFATATTAVVSAARSRAVSKRSSNNSASRSSSSRATGGGNGDQTGGADTGVSEADNELNIRISSKNANAEGTFGSIFRAYGSKLTRYTETQFGYSKSESNRETLNISSQIIYEHEKSDDLTLGYFVGVSLGKDTSNDTMKVDIENSGLQVGSYFVRNITQKVFVDGYVAGSKLFNRMEVATSAMTAEADYASLMVATGLAVTGSATASRWEILPTLAIDYTAVSSENAAFVVTSGAGNSSELSDPGNPRQLGITLASDFRTPFDYYKGYWSLGSTFSFKPHVTCQRVYENGVKLSEECGRGAAFNISSQDANATKTLSFTLGINEIAGDATFSGSILYKAEF